MSRASSDAVQRLSILDVRSSESRQDPGQLGCPNLKRVSDLLKTKRPCCQSKKRCKRCPVVLKRLEKGGLAQRSGKRTYIVKAVPRRALETARVR
jgi:hypothetical protein